MIANLLQTCMLATLSMGGVKTARFDTNEQAIKKTTEHNIATTTDYVYQLSYVEASYTDEQTNAIKYVGQMNNQTAQQYCNAVSYSYTFTNWQKAEEESYWYLTGEKLITFYDLNFYQYIQQQHLDLYYKVSSDSNNATIVAQHRIYKFNNYQDIKQYLDLNNFSNLYLNTPSQATLIDTINNDTLPIYDTTEEYGEINLGSYLTQNQYNQGLMVITEITDINNPPEIRPINLIPPITSTCITPHNYNIEFNTVDFNYEVVDIPTLMLTILTLPFSFISIAFMPITLFPNTPYQLNIGNLIMVILITLIIIWIVKKVIKRT